MLTRDDVSNGNVISTPEGDRRVGGRILSDSGSFVVLTDPDTGVGTLYSEGELYDHEDVSLESRPAASGVGAAQDASQVEALSGEVDRLNKLVDALFERDKVRDAQSRSTTETTGPTDSTDVKSDENDNVPAPVQAPTSAPPEPTTNAEEPAAPDVPHPAPGPVTPSGRPGDLPG